jgi:hypothetical protein
MRDVSVLRFAASLSAAIFVASVPVQALPGASFAPIAAPLDELAPTQARAGGHRGGGVHRGGAYAGGARGGAVVRGPHGGTAAVGGSRHYGGAYHGGAHRGGAYHGGAYRGGAYRGGGVYRGGGAWVRPYGWPVGGAIAAGAAIGFVTAATAAAWASAPPQPGLCWYYTDASQRNGFWDNCPR